MEKFDPSCGLTKDQISVIKYVVKKNSNTASRIA
jgi:hypothetical protein